MWMKKCGLGVDGGGWKKAEMDAFLYVDAVDDEDDEKRMVSGWVRGKC